MKKRIVCVLLTLIMLMSLVPMTASAAGNKVSEAAITVLKQLEGFKSECTKMDGVTAGTPVYVTGYGTVCTKKHADDGSGNHLDKNDNIIAKTTQYEADLALREALEALDEKVNAFATANSMSLSQNQHDALVIFSYDAGSSWTTGNGVVKNAIVNNYGTNELLNALSNWAGEGKVTNRRKIEVNMYVNGIYSNTVPTSYTTVTYDANEGTMAQGKTYVMNYDSSKTVAHSVTPTRVTYKFLGWYNAKNTPSVRYESLTADCAGKTLYAQWQSSAVTAKNAGTTATAVNYTKNVADLPVQLMYYTPEESAASWEMSYKTITITREYVDANGVRWGQIDPATTKTNNRWVRMTGPTVVSTTNGSDVAFQINVTVTNSFVNRRVNATSASAKNGSYSKGKTLLIINEDDGWGQVGEIKDDGSIKAVGWVYLIYTNWDEVREESAATSTPNNTTVIANATVTYNGYLNIRAEAGTDSKIVGALAKNDTVGLYEMKTVNGHQWGRISNGWICLSYTSVDNFGASDITTDAGAAAYIYTAKLDVETNFYADASVDAALRYHSKDCLAVGSEVKILQLKADNEGNTWVKALWYVDNDNDNVKETPLYGWAKMSKFILTPAKYTVVADNVTVRAEAGSGEAAKDIKLAKGVEVTVTEVKLVGENIWGKVPDHDDGWVNLASKYFTRGDVVTNETTETYSTNLMATVINTDSLKVRKTGATYGTIIGSLKRGATVNVWEANADNSWYKVDSNKNGTYDYSGDGWVSAKYVNVYESTTSNTVTDSNGNSYQTDGTGTGIVANTYSGVNVRQGAGTGYAAIGKLLPGTVVEILETKTAGAGKWGRVAQGWISMDYVTMVAYNEVVDNTSNIPEGGIGVDSYDDVEKTTTTAVYTGTSNGANAVLNDSDKNADVVRYLADNEHITIHELVAVKKVVKEESASDNDASNSDITGTTTTITTTETTYWARINDGWVKDPAANISLDALDEKVHTVTGSNTLNVRNGAGTGNTSIGKLAKGDKVTVTSLKIVDDKVWGYIESEDGLVGWSSLAYMSEGAIYENEVVETTPTVTTPPVVIGNGSSTGGFVTNTSGYRYTGKVIRTEELNVRSTPSTGASKTTTLKNGQAVVIYETTTAENMAWGRCDAGWVYLYYIDMTPVTGAVDARVVYNDNTIIYTDMNGTSTAGTYSRMSVVDIYEIVGKMARTELGWVNTDNLL